LEVSGLQENSGNEKHNNEFSNAWISFPKQENFRMTPEMRFCNLKHAAKMPAMVLNFWSCTRPCQVPRLCFTSF
jgi:hypothetical protein